MSTSNPPPPKPSRASKNSTVVSTTALQSQFSTTTTKTSSSLSSHLAMIELKQRILNSISKLSDRDTHRIAVEDLENIIKSLNPDGVSMLLNCLCDSSTDPKPSVKKESLRLLALLCTSHSDATLTHLTKVIAYIVKRLKDSDSGVRDACCNAIGTLSSEYLRGEGDAIALFVKPLFEAMSEQNKIAQGGSAICLAKMVECAGDPPVAAFQKLCPRICKYLNSQNFLAKAALLSVVSSLSQVGAIAPLSFPSLLQSINDCLESSDWATRKAAADTLGFLASHSNHLTSDGAVSTISLLEACRFDKVKPVRDSINDALILWKKAAGNGDETSEDSKDGKKTNFSETTEKNGINKSNPDQISSGITGKEGSPVSSPISDLISRTKGISISGKTVGILKKSHVLSDKEINPDFFQNLETRASDDLPVEVVVPRRALPSSHSHGEEESDSSYSNSRSMLHNDGNTQNPSGEIYGSSNANCDKRFEVSSKTQNLDDITQEKWTVHKGIIRGKGLKVKYRDAEDEIEHNQRDAQNSHAGDPPTESYFDGNILNQKGNWLAIQRQLAQLERQQANLMNMLQDFMGGSHDSMITLENRVRGLERVVEDMARDFSLSSGRRIGNFTQGFEGSSSRPMNKYGFLSDYAINKQVRGRDSLWRSDVSEIWDSHAYASSRSSHTNPRKAAVSSSNDDRLHKPDNGNDQVSNRRGWDKGSTPVRLGEGPSARSVWQASKDEATLEAIRVAGEDNGTSRTATRVAIPELTAEALADEDEAPERGSIWPSWSRAMDALHVGDMDSAYAEVLATEDDMLLVKIMDRSGPIMNQLSNEIAVELLHVLGQFLLEQSLLDIALHWIQQFAELMVENGPDFLGISIETKREILLSLHEASSLEHPVGWEGATPEQLMLQLASVWEIDLQMFQK